MTQLGLAVVWCAAQVGVLGGIAWLLLTVARRAAPRGRAALTLASLLLVMLLSALALAPFPSWWDALTNDANETAATVSGKPSPTSVASAVADADDATPVTADETNTPDSAASSASFLAEFAGAWREELRAEPATVSPQVASTRWWPTWVAFGFLALLLVGAAQLLIGLLLVAGYRRASIPLSDPALVGLVDTLRAEMRCSRDVELRQSLHLTTAATVGWIKPLILLPGDWRKWSQAERRAVLAHEMAHIARRDYLACLCGQLGLLLHYYHPVVHWLVRRMRLEQELAADAAAAAVSGGREAYLRVLAELALRQPDQRLPLPARTFLPTRSTFLRRIDMLRDPRGYATTTNRLGAAAALLLLVTAAISAAGLRGPGPAAVAAPQAPAEAPQRDAAKQSRAAFDTRFVPQQSVYVMAFRPATLVSQPRFKELVQVMSESNEVDKMLGLPIESIDQVVFAITIPEGPKPTRAITAQEAFRRQGAPSVMLRATRPTDWKGEVIKDGVEQRHGGKVYFTSEALPGAFFFPNDRTIVMDTEANIRRLLTDDATRQPLFAGEGWKRVERDDVAVAVDPKEIQRAMEIKPGGPATTNLALVWPLLEHCSGLYCGGRFDQKLHARLYAVCDSEQGAKEVKDTVSASITFGKNLLREAKRAIEIEPPPEPLIRSGIEIASQLLESTSVEQRALGGGDERVEFVQVRAEAEFDVALAKHLAAATLAARAAARRASTMNNLRQIAIAMHNYHDVHGHFPAAAVLGPDGRTPHSWRVALLPFLEQEALYREYRFAEPWDSEHNKKLLERMPAVYGMHSAEPSTNAAVFVLTGPDAMFSAKPAKEGPKVVDLRDGTSNTLMLIEAKRDIPWTKPEDIPYSADKPLPKFGGSQQNGFLAARADGSAQFYQNFTTPEDERRLRALITPNGGEVVDR